MPSSWGREPLWTVETGRLILRPVAPRDLSNLQVLKADPRAFALMLGGIRSPQRTAEELAEEMAAWPRLGYGMWTARLRGDETFVGLTGLMVRPDGRGVGLRFALSPDSWGLGYATEMASAALRFGHERAGTDGKGLPRIIAISRESNIASREVLGGIGMRPVGEFTQNGFPMILFESVRERR